MLKTRVKTAAVLIVLAAVLLYFSDHPVVMAAAAALLGIIAAWELYGICGHERKSLPFAVSALFAAIFPFIPLPNYAAVLIFALPLGALCFALEARDLTRFVLFKRWTPFLFSLIITLFFRSFPALRAGSFGLYTLLLTVAVCVFTDTGAYFIGRALGKHKLAPKISPGKSREGAVGGAAAACILCPLLCLAVPGAEAAYVRALVFSLTASIVGQAGDLALSVLKRITGAKDYGRIMPGHGGVLDRFDSMLFAVSYAVIFMYFFPVFS